MTTEQNYGKALNRRNALVSVHNTGPANPDDLIEKRKDDIQSAFIMLVQAVTAAHRDSPRTLCQIRHEQMQWNPTKSGGSWIRLSENQSVIRDILSRKEVGHNGVIVETQAHHPKRLQGCR